MFRHRKLSNLFMLIFRASSQDSVTTVQSDLLQTEAQSESPSADIVVFQGCVVTKTASQ
jgi:hypothetical protein